jgi:hypothetical protein
MIAKIDEWLQVIMLCAGALVTLAMTLEPDELVRSAQSLLAASADAAGDGAGSPGMGGYIHGFYWRVALVPAVLSLLHITGWETLATAVNVLVAARLAGTNTILSLRGDAALIAHVISKEKSSSRHVQSIIHHLKSNVAYDDISKRLVLQHISGDGNVPSDAVSRGLWSKLRLVADVLRVRLTAVELNAAERALVEAVVRDAAAAAGRERDITATALNDMFEALDGSAETRATALRDASRPTRTEQPTRAGGPVGAMRQLGKRYRSCVDGDGPSPLSLRGGGPASQRQSGGAWTPSWARPRTPVAAPPPVKDPAAHFTPSWARRLESTTRENAAPNPGEHLKARGR